MSLLLDGFENPIKPLKVLPYELGQETSNNNLLMTTNYIEYLDEALIRPGLAVQTRKFISNLPITKFRLSSSTQFSSSCPVKSNKTRNMTRRWSRTLLMVLLTRCPSMSSAQQKFYYFFWNTKSCPMMLFLVWSIRWRKQMIEEKEEREETGGEMFKVRSQGQYQARTSY